MVVVLLLLGIMLLLSNCHRVVTFAVNIPGHFGAFDRHADISYGPNARMRLDIYSPRDAQHRPVVVFWHGGLWVE